MATKQLNLVCWPISPKPPNFRLRFPYDLNTQVCLVVLPSKRAEVRRTL